MADARLDEWMSAPANTPDGSTDTPSPIHTELWSESRVAYEKKVAENIAAEVKNRGLLNPGRPLADLNPMTTHDLGLGQNMVTVANGQEARHVEGLVGCGFTRRPKRGEKFEPQTVSIQINGKEHQLPTNKPFDLTVTGISKCLVTVPDNPKYRFVLAELRAYK
jgi:hypothetical protein